MASDTGPEKSDLSMALAAWERIAKAVEPDPPPYRPNPLLDNILAGRK
jgi:hypothetical protein